MNNNEGFYFEVSPQRKRCLEEQVSTNIKKRSCNCCQKGTVGGYPPNYMDWFNNSSESGNWSRADNWSDSKESFLPPINYIEKKPKSLNTSIYNV